RIETRNVSTKLGAKPGLCGTRRMNARGPILAVTCSGIDNVGNEKQGRAREELCRAHLPLAHCRAGAWLLLRRFRFRATASRLRAVVATGVSWIRLAACRA